MTDKEYKKLVKSKIQKENQPFNLFIAFFIGGLMGVLGQLLTEVFNHWFNLPVRDAYMYTMIVLTLVASILTGFGIFDKAASFAKSGLVVPSTGFAHAMTSAAMDYRKEGLIRGIGANMFKLTGSIIIYTIVVSFFVALLKGVLS